MNCRKRIFFVEGADDKGVVKALLRACKKEVFPFEEACCPANGKGNFSDALGTLALSLKNPAAYDVVAIISDADDNAQRAWSDILKTFRNAFGTTAKRYDFPEKLPRDGFFATPKQSGLPTLGAWIMPDNSSGRMLEDFYLHLIPENDSLLQEAERVLSELESKNLQKYKAIHRSKAKVHTWLAWQENPGVPMGLGLDILKNQMNLDVPDAQAFLGWLKKTVAGNRAGICTVKLPLSRADVSGIREGRANGCVAKPPVDVRKWERRSVAITSCCFGRITRSCARWV